MEKIPKAVVAAEFTDEPRAFIARGMLEDHGIAARVETNNMATLYGAGSTWAPIMLYVAASDLDAATALLREHGDIV